MCQIGVMTGYRLHSIMFEVRCVCHIGVMTAYRLHSIGFEWRCGSDWCDDWLQAVRYKVLTAVCIRLVR
jgi:hypothetical protein